MIASTASTTTVLALLLVVIGFVMIGTTVWLVRSTRRDAPALGPLEVMGDRRFARAGPEGRDATLAAARPAGAHPPSPMVPFDDEVEPAAAVAAEPEAAVVAEPEPEPGPGPEPGASPIVEADVVEAEVVEAEPDPAVDPTMEAAAPAAVVLDADVVDDPDRVGDGSDLESELDAELDAELDLDERVPAPESS